MEFTQYTCPVCKKRFVNGDDVVVCPECGAPHHRECYEELGHCHYEDRHAPGFSFEKADSETDGETDENTEVLLCPNCQAENEKTSFYCCKCGMPLDAQDRQQQQTQQPNNNAGANQGRQMPPFGFGTVGGTAGAPAFDPLSGMDSEEEIADGVKVGEAAKFIGKSTPYYLNVFSRIRKIDRGRFCVSAFLFSGAYFLYRKMYALGIIIILLMIGLTVGSSYLMMSGDWYANYNQLLTDINSGNTVTLFSEKIGYMMLPMLLSSLRMLIMLFCGLRANRIYYNFCAKTIREIKQEEKEEDVNKTLEARGGVNLPMAISFFAAFIVIYEICNFLINSQSFWT